jgi:hypothetical protein
MRGALAAVAAAAAALVGASLLPNASGGEQARIAPGRTLRVLGSNPRYFTDGSGRAVYLTGSHVWWGFVGGKTWKVEPCRNPVHEFSFERYLDQLRDLGHNFLRLWTIELPRWEECGSPVTVAPQPWLRTGPGEALDGAPKFDLRRPNPAYFKRLRQRVAMAAARRIYVSVMLFEGWGLQWHGDWRWRSHPFNAANNVNGVQGDLNGDGTGTEVNTLASRRVTALQEAYVRRVIDAVNRFDNVLYEIANEAGSYSTAWQYHVIRFVKRYEARKGKRHPVGMTFQHAHGDNRTLFKSPADWISPAGREFLTDPPAATGHKVIVSDTDHHCGICGDATFVWKNFLRGHNPILMDPPDGDPAREQARRAMGLALRYALRFDLARSRPRPELSSTQYCLAVPGREYLVYQPGSGPFTVELGPAARRYTVEWLETETGRRIEAPPESGSGRRTFTPPVGGPVLLYLRHLK